MKQREANVDILDRLFWTVQPPIGMIKGDFYRAENWFAPHYDGDDGYLGILEVACLDGRIAYVEFTEINSSSYYIKRYQNVSKRRSDYSFFQATKKRTAESGVVLVNGLTHLENQMMKENRLTGTFDLLTGASNSIKRSMLPLAEEIAGQIHKPSGVRFYSLSQEIQPGVTAWLRVQYADGRLIDVFYDEVFADKQEAIEDVELKPYYRQSKYNCLDYISTIGIGFNSFSDLIGRRAIESQRLVGIEGVPFTSGDKVAQEWRHFEMLAEEIKSEMLCDGLLI